MRVALALFDDESLVSVAADAGLDGDEVLRVLKECTYADQVHADVERARALGVSGVPFFVLAERYGVSGAEPVETFVSALERVYSGPLAK